MVRRVVPPALVVAAAAAVVLIVISARGGSSPPHPSQARAAHARRATGVARRARPRHRRHAAQALPAPPAQVRGAAAEQMPIPILMYHVVAVRPTYTQYPQLWVAPQDFAAEMRALKQAGYYAITLREAYDAWNTGAPLPEHPIVLSFDDGYLGDYTHVRPVLRRLAWPGVLDLTFANLGAGNITPREVRALIAAGWEVDSHTIHHVDVTTLDDAQLHEELAGARERLQRQFGVRADFFCYPSGRYDSRAIAAAKAAGYLGATTTDEGYAQPTQLFTLKRIRVNDIDTPQTLLARLASERPNVPG